MGIPKFFRWLTRRYPMILQTIKRNEDCPPVGKCTDSMRMANRVFLSIQTTYTWI